jgi:hypothetical protein
LQVCLNLGVGADGHLYRVHQAGLNRGIKTPGGANQMNILMRESRSGQGYNGIIPDLIPHQNILGQPPYGVLHNPMPDTARKVDSLTRAIVHM